LPWSQLNRTHAKRFESHIKRKSRFGRGAGGPPIVELKLTEPKTWRNFEDSMQTLGIAAMARQVATQSFAAHEAEDIFSAEM
jgi:hypothetical protein